MRWIGPPRIEIEEIPMHLDMLSKMYELWGAGDLEMSGKDEEFITSLAERVQASDNPIKYQLTQPQEIWIQDCWDRYMEEESE